MVKIDIQQLNTFGGKNACEDCACPMQVVSANGGETGNIESEVIVRRGVAVEGVFESVVVER